MRKIEYLEKINLQLFGESHALATADIQRTTDNTQNVDDMSVEMKTFYNKALLESAKPNLVYQQLGKKTSLPANNGKIVEWRRFSDLAKATTALEEGVTPAGHKFYVTKITAEVRQYGDYTIVSDVLSKTTIDPIIVEFTKKHGANASLTIDTITRDEIMTGTNVAFAPKADGTVVSARQNLDTSCIITPKTVARVASILKKKNAPTINGSYVAVIHPSVEFDLITDPNWIDVNKYSNTEKIFNGEIGKLYNVRFLVSTEAKIWAKTTDNCPADTEGGSSHPALAVYGSVFVGQDAFGVVDLEGGGLEMIIKDANSGGVENALNQRGSVGWKVTGYCAKILQPDYMVRLESCSSFSKDDTAN